MAEVTSGPIRLEPTDAMWTTNDVAEHFGVSTKTVYNWLRRPETPLPCFRVGTVVRFHRESVLRWAKDQETGR